MKLLLKEWRDFLSRCIWSWHGIAEVWRNEASFRSWLIVNIISAAMTFVIDLSGAERAIILSVGVLILAAESMNSAIERAVDYISEDIHPLAKAAKDAGSAAVALSAVAGGIAWLAILIG